MEARHEGAVSWVVVDVWVRGNLVQLNKIDESLRDQLR
jgi:hypothetical protein